MTIIKLRILQTKNIIGQSNTKKKQLKIKDNSMHENLNSSFQHIPMIMMNKSLLHINQQFLYNLLEIENSFMKKSIKNHWMKYDISNVAIWNFKESSSSSNNVRFKVQFRITEIHHIVINGY